MNPILFSEKQFHEQLKAFSQSDVFTGYLIVNEKNGELSQTHVIRSLWEKFKGALGLQDWTNKSLVEFKTIDFLLKGKSWLKTPEDIRLVKTLATRVGLTPNGTYHQELQELINELSTPSFSSTAIAKENLLERFVKNHPKDLSPFPPEILKITQTFNRVILSPDDNENSAFTSEEEHAPQDQESEFSSKKENEKTLVLEDDAKKPLLIRERPSLASNEAVSSLLIKPSTTSLPSPIEDQLSDPQEAEIIETPTLHNQVEVLTPLEKNSRWTTAAKVALVATASFVAITAGYYAWQYFTAVTENAINDPFSQDPLTTGPSHPVTPSNPITETISNITSYFSDKVITYYKDIIPTPDGDFTPVPENFFNSTSNAELSEQPQTLPIQPGSMIDTIRDLALAVIFGVAGVFYSRSSKDKKDISGYGATGDDDDIFQTSTQNVSQNFLPDQELLGIPNFSGVACYQNAALKSLFHLPSFVALMQKPITKKEVVKNEKGQERDLDFDRRVKEADDEYNKKEGLRKALLTLYESLNEKYDDRNTQIEKVSNLAETVSDLVFASDLHAEFYPETQGQMQDSSAFIELFLDIFDYKLSEQVTNTGVNTQGVKTTHSRDFPITPCYLIQLPLPKNLSPLESAFQPLFNSQNFINLLKNTPAFKNKILSNLPENKILNKIIDAKKTEIKKALLELLESKLPGQEKQQLIKKVEDLIFSSNLNPRLTMDNKELILNDPNFSAIILKEIFDNANISVVPLAKQNEKSNLQTLIDKTETLETDTDAPWEFNDSTCYPQYCKTTVYVGNPDLLVVQLKRGNSFNADGQAVEDRQEIEFPEDELFDFSTSFGQNDPLNYQMQGFIYRFGNTGSGGHYQTYLKEKNGWVCYDSSVGTPVSEIVAKQYMAQAYIFLFDKNMPITEDAEFFDALENPTDNGLLKAPKVKKISDSDVFTPPKTLKTISSRSGRDPISKTSTQRVEDDLQTRLTLLKNQLKKHQAQLLTQQNELDGLTALKNKRGISSAKAAKAQTQINQVIGKISSLKGQVKEINDQILEIEEKFSELKVPHMGEKGTTLTPQLIGDLQDELRELKEKENLTTLSKKEERKNSNRINEIEVKLQGLGIPFERSKVDELNDTESPLDDGQKRIQN